jgi:hypothetical protein
MPFCPQCKYEYKPGVETCPDCGARLVEHLQPPPEPRPEVPLVKIAEGLRPMVEMLANILRKRDIDSLVKPAGAAWQIEIWIRSDDLEQHRSFIEDEARSMGDHIIWFPGFRD